MALCKHAPKLDPGAHATMRVRTKAVHHAVRIDRQENSGYITLVPSLRLHIGQACEAGLSAGMWRQHVPPHRRKKTKEGNQREVGQMP